jgi:hypothetical protein
MAPLVQSNAIATLIQRETRPRPRTRVPLTEHSKDLKAILPTKHLLEYINQVAALENIFTKQALALLARRIRSDKNLTRFVRRHGVAGFVALFDARLDLAKAQKLLQTNRKAYTRGALGRREQVKPLRKLVKTLGKVERWAESKARRQAAGLGLQPGTASPTWARDLATAQRQNVRRVIDQLQARISMVRAGTVDVRNAASALRRAEGLMNDARKQRQSIWASLIQLTDAADAIAQAHDLLIFARYQGIGGSDKYIQRASKLVAQVKQRAKQDGAARTLNRVAVDKLRSESVKLQQDIRKTLLKRPSHVTSLQRIIFVLRYFLALNDPKSRDVPTLDEARKWARFTGTFDGDLKRFFDPSWGKLTLFKAFAARLEKQIKSRLAMHRTLRRDPGLVPSRQDVEAYFRSLRRRSNARVIDAYKQYAAAFFQHRGVTASSDLRIRSAANVYGKPINIVGTRLLVCGCYAVLGSHLLRQARARHVKFILGARVSQADLLKGSDITDVHALAHLRRRGRNLYVSNDEIVYHAGQGSGGGFSRNEIAWDNKNNRLIRGKGTTMARALRNLQNRIQQAAHKLRRRRKGR